MVLSLIQDFLKPEVINSKKFLKLGLYMPKVPFDELNGSMGVGYFTVQIVPWGHLGNKVQQVY